MSNQKIEQMTTADVLLQSAMTFRDASRRSMPVSSTFDHSDDAVRTWIDVVLHEANVAMSEPLEARPECPYLHPVDIDTSDPGIVSDRASFTIQRTSASSVPRIHYHNVTSLPTPDLDDAPQKTFSVSERVANTKAQKKQRETDCARGTHVGHGRTERGKEA